MSRDLPFGADTIVIPFTWEGRRPARPATGRMTRMRPAGWLYRYGVVDTSEPAAPLVASADPPQSDRTLSLEDPQLLRYATAPPVVIPAPYDVAAIGLQRP